MIKILNITSITELRGGDAQMYSIYNLLKDKSDLEQLILCPNNSVLATICKKDQANYYTYNKNSFKLLNLIVAILQICKKEQITLIHIHDSSALNAGLIAMNFLPSSISLILSRKRNNKIKDKMLNRFKYSHPKIIKIISVSKAVEAVFENIIVDKERLITIYDAIDVSKFCLKKNQELLHKEFDLSPQTKIIGNIAGLTKQKDIYTFIDTAKKTIDKCQGNYALKFIVVGDGPLKSELITYIENLNLENDIIFAGFRNNIEDLLPEFDVFLNTSITEGLPLTIYEAMACKIPIVATKAGGIPEVIFDNETGFLADLKDSELLSAQILKILDDEKLCLKIKENAFSVVKSMHDLSVMENNYYNLYKSFR